MRILLISHTSQSRAEGHAKARFIASHAEVRLRVLVPERWRHYGVWRSADAALEPKNFELQVSRVRLPWAGPAQYYLHHYPCLADTIREFEPDIIDVWEEPWALVSLQALRLRDRLHPKAKFVAETEQNINKQLPFPFEQIRKRVLADADYAIGRSAEAAAALRDKGYRGPITVVPNGVDSDLFRPMDRNHCRQTVGASGFVIGYAGRFVPQKGLVDLLDAVAGCDVSVNVILIGSGPTEPQLRERTAVLGLTDRVRFVPDQSQAELVIFMNAMDCFVLPSRTTARWKEQFGRVLIEASACGTPVLGSDSGAIPTVVGNTGLIYPEGDSQALSVAIERLRSDPAFAASLGESARIRVEQHYTWRRVAEQMYAVYNSLGGSAAGSKFTTSLVAPGPALHAV